jgi:two-component system cell cycle sensor histidine kinase/response regulator CckA
VGITQTATNGISAPETVFSRSVLEALPNGLIVYSADGQCSWVNESAVRLLGIPRKRLLRQTFREIPFWKGSDLLDLAEETMRTGHPHQWDQPRCPDSNKSRRLDVRLTRVYLDGEATLLVVLTDVTERKQAEEALRAREERCQALADTTSDLMFSFDRDLNLTGINRAAARSLGLKMEEALGRHMANLGLPPETHRRWKRKCSEVLATGRPAERLLNEFTLADGRTHLNETSLWPILTSGGDVVGVQGATRDITERKQAEELLSASEQRYRALLSSANDGILLHDLEGRILEVNGVLSERLGYSSEDLMGMKVTSIRDAGAAALYPEHMDEVRRRGRAVFETTYRRRDGSAVPIEVSSRLIEDAGREVVLSISRDVTERKKTEEALRESETRYQTLVNLSPDGITVDIGGKYAFANPAAARLFGADSPREIVGQELLKRIHPDDRELVARRAAQVSAGAWTTTEKIRILRLDGTPVEVEVAGSRIEFDGSPANQVVLHDITERKQAERELQIASHAIEHAGIGAMRLDKQGRIREVNGYLCQLLGYSHEELLQMTLFDVTVDLEASAWPRRWEELKELGPVTLEKDYRTRSGETIPVEISVSIVQFEGEEYDHVFIRDITDRMRAEEERLQLERQLQQSQKLEGLGVLAGGIAHDFNNILTGVLGNAELALAELSASAPAREYLLEISQASHRAAALCRQMLAYSGRGRFASEPIDLSELIEEMLGLLRSTISKKALLRLNLQKDLPLLEGDPSQLGQVIMNLVLNASESLGDEDGVITIATGTRECSHEYFRESYASQDLPSGLYLTLEVSDTGCGMDAETQKHLFEPFFTTKFTGRGLGLAAVVGIVRGHRGALRVYSEPGKGTTFKMRFPAAKAGTGAPLGEVNASAADWQGMGTVLLVDDEEAIRALGARMLASLGFEVLTAADGREALSLYAEHRGEIALVLLDLTMPHMDGEEALRELRLIDPEVRVVMSSGYTESDIAPRFAGKGLVGFLQKPFTLAQLEEQLRAALHDREPIPEATVG